MSEPAYPLTDSAPATAAAGWKLEHTYAGLPDVFFARVKPTPVRAPRLIQLNRALAEQLGFAPDVLAGEEGAAVFAGNRLPPGAEPLAQAYAGHQFGHFTTLGDGRAILLGEQVTPTGARFDVQLKGSGPTPYSRRGDGRAALGPMLREYLVSEAMHALRIPTTRSLAVVATGEEVWRQEPSPGAVLTRVAASHIRVGTFEWAAALRDESALRALLHYTVRRHYPELLEADNVAEAFLRAVVERQASLIAQWMLVGFIHGVMNTDNMALSGETIDYGPCAFMDAYDPATVFSSIDARGRYAYANQPAIAGWNLARLAECLVPLLDQEEERAVARATEAVETFAPRFLHHWHAGLRRKLGLFTEEPEDRQLFEALFAWMQRTRADFTLTFANLSVERSSDEETCVDEGYVQWHAQWLARLQRQPEGKAESEQLRRDHNPVVIPRNHRVEAALTAAAEGDLNPLEQLLEALASPYDRERPIPDEFRQPDPNGGAGYRTYCGT